MTRRPTLADRRKAAGELLRRAGELRTMASRNLGRVESQPTHAAYLRLIGGRQARKAEALERVAAWLQQGTPA